MEKQRIHFFDSLKAILLLLVVFGHVLEPIANGKLRMIYLFIYAFHMPLFAFCSGYLAKFNPRKILTQMLYPYLVFQTVYYLFSLYVMNKNAVFQFSTPRYALWYILAMVFWSLLVPLLALAEKKGQMIATLLCLLLLGLAVGFDKNINGFLTISRTLCFLPYFAAGFYLKKAGGFETLISFLRRWAVRIPLLLLSAALLIPFYLYRSTIEKEWMYFSHPYNGEGLTIGFRCLQYLAAILLSCTALSLTPHKKLWFSYAGQYTLTVYLLHILFKRLIDIYSINSLFPNPYLALLWIGMLSVGLVLLLSSKPVRILSRPLIDFNFFLELRKRPSEAPRQP